jgi:hypothetical protein
MELLAASERKPSTGFGADGTIAAKCSLGEIDLSFVPNGSTVTTSKNMRQ